MTETPTNEDYLDPENWVIHRPEDDDAGSIGWGCTWVVRYDRGVVTCGASPAVRLRKRGQSHYMGVALCEEHGPWLFPGPIVSVEAILPPPPPPPKVRPFRLSGSLETVTHGLVTVNVTPSGGRAFLDLAPVDAVAVWQMYQDHVVSEISRIIDRPVYLPGVEWVCIPAEREEFALTP